MNAKMKVLSLALVGLCGFAGSAMAACPTDPAAAGGGAWSSKNIGSDASYAITAGGYGNPATACKLDLKIGAASNTRALVTDDSPNNEQRYRARFYFNVSSLTGLTAANQQVKIFNASATTGPASASTAEVTISLLGSASGKALRFQIADASQASMSRLLTAALPASASGTYYVEFDLQHGASVPTDNFKFWVADTNTTTDPNLPTGKATVDTTGWSGVKSVNLGLFSSTANFRTAVAGQTFSVDEFDSRRQTFIGR